MDEYILVQDDSCHWYVIPADKKTEWHTWESSIVAEKGVIPEWAKEVLGNPSLVKFKEFRID